MNIWLKSGVAFCAMVLLDVVFAKYTLAVTEHQAVVAGGWAAGIALCSAVVTTSYVKDQRTIPACLAGAFVGTYLALTI